MREKLANVSRFLKYGIVSEIGPGVSESYVILFWERECRVTFGGSGELRESESESESESEYDVK